MLYRKRVITLMFVVLSVFIFCLVLPGETKLTSLFSFLLVAFLVLVPTFGHFSQLGPHFRIYLK